MCAWSVTDAANPPASRHGSISIDIDPPASPPLRTIPLPSLSLAIGAFVRAPLVDVTGGVPPYAYALSCTPALPSELSFDTESGLLFGVPAAPYDAVCRWSVTDADTPPSRRHGSFPVDIRSQPASSLRVVPVSSLSLTLGAPVRISVLDVTGGVLPYAYALSCTPALPSELSFDTETGLLFGVPAASYDAVCRWSVTDADTPPSRRHGSFPVDVRSSAGPLRAALHGTSFDTSTPPVLALSTGVSVSRRLIDASGGIGRLSYSLGCTLPLGLSFSTQTGWLSGTPARSWYGACDWWVEDASVPPERAPSPPGTFILSVEGASVEALRFDGNACVPGSDPCLRYDDATLDFEISRAIRYALPPVLGGVPAYAFTLGSDCPSWLRISSLTLSGLPARVSPTPVLCSIEVADSAGAVATWVVPVRATAAPPNAFVFESRYVPDRHLPVGQSVLPIALPRALNSGCAASAADCPLVYRLSPPLPAGLCLAASSSRDDLPSTCGSGHSAQRLSLSSPLRAGYQPYIIGTPALSTLLTAYSWSVSDASDKRSPAPFSFNLATPDRPVPRFTNIPDKDKTRFLTIMDAVVRTCDNPEDPSVCPGPGDARWPYRNVVDPLTLPLPLPYLPPSWSSSPHYSFVPKLATDSRFAFRPPRAAGAYPRVAFDTRANSPPLGTPEPHVAFTYGVARTAAAAAPAAGICVDLEYGPSIAADGSPNTIDVPVGDPDSKLTYTIQPWLLRYRFRDAAQRSTTGEFLCEPRPLGDDPPATTAPGAGGVTPPSNPVHEALVPFHAQTAMRNAHSAVEAYVRDVDRDPPAHGAVRLVPHVERHGISGTHRGFSFSGAGEAAAAAAGLPLDPFHAGVAVSSSTLDLAYVAGPDAPPDYLRGEHTAELHSAHPFIAWRNPSGSTVWAAVGAGHGRLRHRDVLDLDPTYAWADLSLRTWGAGASVPVLATALPGSMALRALAEGWRVRVRPDLGSRISDALPVFTGREAALGVRWSGAARSGFSPWAGVDWRARGGAGPSGRVLGAEAGLRLSRRTPVPLRASVGGGLERAVSSGADDRRWRLAADVALGASGAALGPGASLRAECPGRDCALRSRLGWRLPAPRPWRSVAPYVAATGGAGVSARAVGLELTAPGDSVLSVELARRASHSSGALMLRLEVPL